MHPSIPEVRQNVPPIPQQKRYANDELRSSAAAEAARRPFGVPGSGAEMWMLRGLLFVAAAAICRSLQPGGLSRVTAGLLGLFFAALVLGVEWRSRKEEPADVLGGAMGAAAGIFVALLTVLLVSRTALTEPGKSCLEYLSLIAFGYLGLVLGARQGSEALRRWGGTAVQEEQQREGLKLLDTSVLIDGRIADISDAHFLDGVLVVPQFVLRELQMVADSNDPLKRQRGRRGLEVLQRMQKMTHIDVRILDDAALDGEVDDKLVELARRTGAKIVTNDFNLNKVATVQGLAVLNVNLLANAMKPVVLPGEAMRVLILREGKEPNQGVAYLDDGTMVVVDNARRLINKSVDVVVTSVHQTTAGKMIFGRVDERAEQNSPSARQAAAGASSARGDVAQNAGDNPPQTGRQPGSGLSDRGNG
jgi:uncharacterized protein YacL